MMKEKFERIAEEGVVREMLRQHGTQLPPHQERVAIEINIRLNKKLKPLLVGKLLDQSRIDEIQETTIQVMKEILRELAAEYREAGDWDAFAEVHFIRGRT